MAGRSAVAIHIENEKFTVVCTHFHQNLKFGNFTLSLGRLCQRIFFKCVHACAAGLFFLIQPMRSLFSGIFLA